MLRMFWNICQVILIAFSILATASSVCTTVFQLVGKSPPQHRKEERTEIGWEKGWDDFCAFQNFNGKPAHLSLEPGLLPEM